MFLKNRGEFMMIDKFNVQEIIENSILKIDVGMNIDIKVFLQSSKDIKSYDLEIKEECQYLIKVVLKKFSVQNAKKSFDSFIKFIRYNYFNLYVFEEEPNALKIHYYTINDSNIGANFSIIYS